MRMHRRAALAAVALLSAVSLAACGGSASTPHDGGLRRRLLGSGRRTGLRRDQCLRSGLAEEGL